MDDLGLLLLLTHSLSEVFYVALCKPIAAQDQVYAKRKNERKEQDQERHENLKQKRQLVEELTRAAAADPEELLAGQSVLARFRDRFNEVGYVPRKAEKSLLDSWRKAQKDYSAALRQAEQVRAQTSQNALLDKARACAALELKKLGGEAIMVMLTGGALLALPFTVASYFLSLSFFTSLRQKKKRMTTEIIEKYESTEDQGSTAS